LIDCFLFPDSEIKKLWLNSGCPTIGLTTKVIKGTRFTEDSFASDI